MYANESGRHWELGARAYITLGNSKRTNTIIHFFIVGPNLLYVLQLEPLVPLAQRIALGVLAVTVTPARLPDIAEHFEMPYTLAISRPLGEPCRRRLLRDRRVECVVVEFAPAFRVIDELHGFYAPTPADDVRDLCSQEKFLFVSVCSSSYK